MTDRFAALKDPQEVLPFTLDWNRWLVSPDVISSHTVTVPAGITKDSSSDTDTTVTAVISGGTAGTSYDVTYHVTTSLGVQGERTLTLYVEQR
jgi:hypothetical protein